MYPVGAAELSVEPQVPLPHLVFSHHSQHGFLWLPTVRSLAHLEASTNALLS